MTTRPRTEKLEKQLSENHEERKTVATPADVAAAVERLTGIPVSKMGASDIERLKGSAAA